MEYKRRDYYKITDEDSRYWNIMFCERWDNENEYI